MGNYTVLAQQKRFVEVVDIQVGMIAVVQIAVANEHLEDLRMVGGRTVSKQPQVEHKALGRNCQIPHLVNCHKWLVEEQRESHSDLN